MKLKFIIVFTLLSHSILSQKPTQEFSKIHAGSITGIKFSPAGNLMATFANDSNILIWETHPLKVKGSLKGHLKKINTVDFSPDGTSLVSGSDDGTIQLWDLSTMTSYWTTTNKMRFF
ncbi:MAG: hypothetical protein IPP71_08015 [Bacteroidetes bacterium]|nr:hypothetical protein [Bacteroidota bacterium]